MTNKKLLFSSLCLILIVLNSCKINTSSFTCSKFATASSVAIEELLKSPNNINIDNKEYKLYAVLDLNKDLQNHVYVFPKLYSEVVNDCVKRINFKILHTLPNGNQVDLKLDYKPERTWLIADNSKVWESSDIEIDSNINNSIYYKYSVNTIGPSIEEYKERRLIVKMKDSNGKEFFISTDDKNLILNLGLA